MKFRVLATLIIAALLLTGVAAAAADGTEYGVTTGAPAQTDAPAVAYLTAQEAETIALAHSGYTAEQVTGLRSEYDVDHGVAEYEIEFRGDDWEYDYTIHAETGEVLSCEEEYDAPKTAPAETVPAETKPAKAPETKAPKTKPAATEAPVTLLTADEAKAIALAHAGLTAEEVTGLRAEYDVDNGVKEYEVDFRGGDWEYDYEINAETGAVIAWDKEYDPPKPAATEPAATEPPATEAPATLLTADEAKAIALAHAGLTAEEVKKLEAEFDYDDGRPEYEVEFRYGGLEYSYEIHGETGKILDMEKDD